MTKPQVCRGCFDYFLAKNDVILDMPRVSFASAAALASFLASAARRLRISFWSSCNCACVEVHEQRDKVEGERVHRAA